MAVFVGAVAILAVAYGPHVVNGGFYNDDWTDTSFMYFEKHVRTVLEQVHAGYAHRPLYVLYGPVLHWVVGDRPWLLNSWSLVLATGFAVAMWAVLREYGLGAIPAAAAAYLTVLFPFADSSRLWAASSHMTLSLTLFCVGMLATLRAFSRDGSRALWLHVAAATLYLASLAIFEITAGLIAGSGLLYILSERRRRAYVRWALDIVIAVLFVAIFTVGQQTAYERSGLSGQLENAQRIVDQAWTLFAWAAVPFGDARRDVTTLVVMAVVAAGVATWRFGPPPLAGQARRWLVVAGAGMLVIGLGYLPFVPADPNQYQPLFHGGQNRVNMAASPGYAIVFVALAQLAGLAVAAVGRLRPAVAGAIGVAIVVLLGLGMAGDVAKDRAVWARSWDRQTALLAEVKAKVPRPQLKASILTFGHAGAEQFGVPLLGGQYDVTHALRLTYRRPDITGAAVLQGTRLDCGAQEVTLTGGSSDGYRAQYGRTTFVDVGTHDAQAITSPARCRQVLPRMTPGPVYRVNR